MEIIFDVAWAMNRCVEKLPAHYTYDASTSLPLITITFAACACNKRFDDNEAYSPLYNASREKKTKSNQIKSNHNLN